jgi:pimeloyl-ACP methyl ester carboxylesterase
MDLPSAAWALDPARLRRVGVWAAALALGWIGSGTIAALGLTRRWRDPVAEPAPDDVEALRLSSRDGIEIGAFLGEVEAPRTAIVLVHGNGSSRSALTDEARALRALGHTVLSIPVRAHGDSGGTRNDFGWSARYDVEAAVAQLEARLARAGRGETPIVVLGISLGSAAALFAAPTLGGRVAGYVLVGPYASLADATARRTERYLPPILSELAFGALWVGGRIVLPELDRIAPRDAAAHMPRDVPVLVIVGEADARAPLEDARAITGPLEEAAIVVAPGLDHEEVSAIVAAPEGLAAIAPFLDGLACAGRPAP